MVKTVGSWLQSDDSSYQCTITRRTRGSSDHSMQSAPCPTPCQPSALCRAAVLDWSVHHGGGFIARSLGLKRLTVQLHRLLRCFEDNLDGGPALIIDVGAGIHGLSREWVFRVKNLHDDDSDSLWLLGSFGSRASVHAFEANPAKAAELRAAAAVRPLTSKFTDRFTVHNMGVGAASGTSRVAMCGGANTWSVHGNAGVASFMKASPSPSASLPTHPPRYPQ